MHRMHEYDFSRLEYLAFTPGDDSDDVDTQFEITRSIPLDLFDGRMPRLRGLSLFGIDAPWQSISNLRYLSLSAGHDLAAAPIPLHILLAVLRSSPEVHTLKLDMMVDFGLTEGLENVQLPVLELLHLRDGLYRCQDVLAHITLPSTARLELYPQGIRSGQDVRDILVLVRKHIRARGAHLPRMLKLTAPHPSEAGERGHFLTAVYADAIFPGLFSRDVLCSLNAHPASAPAQRQIIIKVLKALPTTMITHLDAGSAHLTTRTWKTVFALLPALQAVCVQLNESGTRFVEAALEFGVWRWRHVRVNSLVRPSVEDHVLNPFLEALTSFLRACHARETPLEVLEIIDYLHDLEFEGERWVEID
ncbi:hypothetical protein DFH06DRAFT_1475093, partial [Mycena polygramma]